MAIATRPAQNGPRLHFRDAMVRFILLNQIYIPFRPRIIFLLYETFDVENVTLGY